MKKTLLILFLTLMIVFAGFFTSQVSAERFLTYFPPDTSIDIVNQGYPPESLVLRPIACGADLLDSQHQLCNDCLDYRADCPDCCLIDLSGDGDLDAIRCEDGPRGESQDFDCPDELFSSQSCEVVECPQLDNLVCPPDWRNVDGSVIPGCQAEGCPDIEPDGVCLESGGLWYCTADNLLPEDRGCQPNPGINIAHYNSNFHLPSPAVSLFYQNIEHIYPSVPGAPGDPEDQDDPGVPGHSDFNQDIANLLGVNSYYRYEVAHGYGDYINNCLAYTRQEEECTVKTLCCSNALCGGQGIGACNNCELRLDFKTQNILLSDLQNSVLCPFASRQNCADLLDAINICLEDVDGVCSDCYEDIDSNFSYDFIPKSGESLTIFWNIDAVPFADGPFRPYFYTMVKVVNEEGIPVYSSMMHQKSFTQSFSIYNATHVRADPDILNVGERHSVRLVYYIPDVAAPGVNVGMEIFNLEMTIVKVKE